MAIPPLRSLVLALFILPLLSTAPAQGQLADRYPDLDVLVRSADPAHARALEAVNTISGAAEATEARAELAAHLERMMTMSMAEMMQMSSMDAHMAGGYFGAAEASAFDEILALIGSADAASTAGQAYRGVSVLPERAATVLSRGRDLHRQIFDIYTDDSIGDKTAAVNTAVREYLEDPSLSVPSQPKNASLMFSHQYASAFKTGFPEVSGLVWATNWLRLAALDPIMSTGEIDRTDQDVDAVIARYESKLEPMAGMRMMLPTEMPTTTAIAPLLQNRHQNAAVILDNVAMLETVIADLLVHPAVEDRTAAIEAAVNNFTNRSTDLTGRREYLLASLRAGIFAQGGPAMGSLTQSERNRSRMEMEMGPHIMPGMN